jgi:T5SS/PEP-CTERM-associated repeat protein
VDGDFTLAAAGEGSLTILDNSRLEVGGDLNVASEAGSDGTIVITGTGARLETAHLNIGGDAAAPAAPAP